jgi:hypothetical protein
MPCEYLRSHITTLMKKIYVIVLTFIFFGLGAEAQKVSGSVRGVLMDSISKQPLADATVSLVDLKDSSLISFSLTDENGRFEIKNIAAGDYQVVSSFTGLQSLRQKISITADNPQIDLGAVNLSRNYKALDEIIITDDAPVKVKGDTLAFRADAFKTKPNATVEDLLKKLPGMQVEKDGTVKAQGETVQKVYVDGKEFFSNDPKLATKNLTAEMIDQVEVYDDMSEQAKFNGIDDGSRTKAINLKLKKDKKKGTFGRANAGVGTSDRYDAGITTNFFKGATQGWLIAKTNNTNNMGFTMSDNMGMFSGGGGGGGNMMVRGGFPGGGSGGNTSFGSGGTGITTTTQAGVNYRDMWGKKLSVNGSYFYNHANRENQSLNYRQSFFPNFQINREQQSITQNQNGNHRFNLNMVWEIDSFNSIVFTPNVSTQRSQSNSEDTVSSWMINNNDSYLQSANMNNHLIWRRKFNRKGRTLSVNLNTYMNNSDRSGFNLDDQRNYLPSGDLNSSLYRNYMTNTDSRNNNYSVNVSYTEPIGRNKLIELNYNRYNSRSESDRNTWDYNGTSKKYDRAVDSLTNEYQSSNLYDRYGGNFRLAKKKYNLQLGFSVQNTQLETQNLTLKSNISNHYTNLFPTASFNYNFSRGKSLRFNYRGRTNQPSASQLDSTTDYSRYPYIYKGNPSLDQEVGHNFSLNFNSFDAVTFRNFFASLSYSSTQNKITNAIDQRGNVEYTTPVNLDGAFNLNGNVNVGFPIKKMRGGNINFTTKASYYRDVNLVNLQKNFTSNMMLGEDVRLNYNFRDKLDLGVTASVMYNSVNYTNSFNNDNSYYTHAYSVDATYTLPGGFILSSDLDYTFYTGRTDGFNQNYVMWNGGLARKVFKNKRGELKLSVFDILNQNISVTRNVNANYIEDVQNTVLKRFGLLSFTYQFNRMGGKNIPASGNSGGRDIIRMGN